MSALVLEELLKERIKQQQVHRRISYLKSVLRVFGYFWLPLSLKDAAVLLIIAELLGIAEEVWG